MSGLREVAVDDHVSAYCRLRVLVQLRAELPGRAGRSIEWLCLPRPDSPSVFGALLDRAAGSFRFGPTNVQVPQHRRYIPGTMVLETTWQTPTGWMTVQDFLVIGPIQAGNRRPDYHQAPSDFGALGALVRIATCISGRVEAVVNCGPLFNYGSAGGTWNYQGDGYNAMTIAPKERGLAA
jgi:GH15 family glucan-1,4-alpha-glucosidase